MSVQVGHPLVFDAIAHMVVAPAGVVRAVVEGAKSGGALSVVR